MVKQFRAWLGPQRMRLLIVALVLTGFISLILAAFAPDENWSLAAQTFLVLIFLGITLVTVGSRMQPESRRKLFFTVGPALGLVALSIIAPSNLATIIAGMGFGWLLAAQFFFRNRMEMEYRVAIKHMRKQEYKEAVEVIGDLIKKDPKNPQHLEFRARLHRLSGHMGAAIKDYEKVIRLAADEPSGYNGLAEVFLQQGKFEEARQQGMKAYELAPDYWVTSYNLGMVEDRMGRSQDVINHLDEVLERGLPDSRHRLLTHLWLARAHDRMGDKSAAQSAINDLKREKKGLQEWRLIFADEQSKTLRGVLEHDVQLAERAFEDGATVDDLFKGEGR
jgi:tetratricopeptide (TPR) repeat protein